MQVYTSEHSLPLRQYGSRPNNVHTKLHSVLHFNQRNWFEIITPRWKRTSRVQQKWTRWQESQDCVTWNESVFPANAVRKRHCQPV